MLVECDKKELENPENIRYYLTVSFGYITSCNCIDMAKIYIEAGIDLFKNIGCIRAIANNSNDDSFEMISLFLTNIKLSSENIKHI